MYFDMNERLYVALGLSYAGLGEKQKAIEAGQRAVQILDISKDALEGHQREGGLMRIYIMVGEYDLALQLIRKLLNHSGPFFQS